MYICKDLSSWYYICNTFSLIGSAIQKLHEGYRSFPMVASYYGNRSIAYLRTEAFGYALQDASRSLEVDKNYIKVGMYSLKLFTLHIVYTYVLHTV